MYMGYRSTYPNVNRMRVEEISPSGSMLKE